MQQSKFWKALNSLSVTSISYKYKLGNPPFGVDHNFYWKTKISGFSGLRSARQENNFNLWDFSKKLAIYKIWSTYNSRKKSTLKILQRRLLKNKMYLKNAVGGGLSLDDE